MFSEKLKEAFRTGKYTCDECGWPMIFEDEWESVLICTNPDCGYSCEIDDYGTCEEERALDYPTEEEARILLGEEIDEEEIDEIGETYEEVYDELDD